MTDTTEPGPAAIAAANWWAKAIRQPSFNNGGDGTASILMTMVNARKPEPTLQQQSSFAVLLANRIQADLDRRASWDKSDIVPGITLGVDYGPDAILAEPAREAGIKTAFPWKTMMWVRADHITVSAGSGAPVQLVWASDEWQANRPICDAQKWDEAKSEKIGWRDYHGEPWACSLPKYHEEREHVYDAPLVLCATCGALDDWHHDPQERGHMPDFHEFVAPVSV